MVRPRRGPNPRRTRRPPVGPSGRTASGHHTTSPVTPRTLPKAPTQPPILPPDPQQIVHDHPTDRSSQIRPRQERTRNRALEHTYLTRGMQDARTASLRADGTVIAVTRATSGFRLLLGLWVVRTPPLMPLVRTSTGAGVEVAWLLGHTGESQVPLQLAADQAGSKHSGESPHRGKAGPASRSRQRARRWTTPRCQRSVIRRALVSPAVSSALFWWRYLLRATWLDGDVRGRWAGGATVAAPPMLLSASVLLA